MSVFSQQKFISFSSPSYYFTTMPSAAERKQQLEAACAEWLRQEMEEQLWEERELQEIEEEERWEEEERQRREEEERRRAEEACLAEEARIAEEMRRAAEEEERAAEEARKAAEPESGSWEERIRALRLLPPVEEEMTPEAAKSGSLGACYHCRTQKRECVRPR